MRTFKKILVWLVIIIALLILVSYLLPRNYKVERYIYIKAGRSLIFDLTSNYSKWNIWTPWTKESDSTVTFTLTGEEGQIGTEYSWDGKILGNGKMTLTEVVPDEMIRYDISFQKGKYQSMQTLLIEDVTGDSCKVTWTDQGDLGYNPISRYMGPFMGRMIGPEFDKGLTKLKKVAEERKNWPQMEITMMPEQIVLLIRDSAGPADYGWVLGKGYGELTDFVDRNRLKCTNPPFAIYLKWDSVTMFSVMDLGMAVENATKASGRIRIEKIPSQTVAVAHYFGGYDKTAETYYILEEFIRESGKEIAGGPWEIYLTDPMVEKDTTKWATDILFPVR